MKIYLNLQTSFEKKFKMPSSPTAQYPLDSLNIFTAYRSKNFIEINPNNNTYLW